MTVLAKFIMRRFEVNPDSPGIDVGELNEIFRHRMFLEGTPEERKKIMRRSSQTMYEDEKRFPWDSYFKQDLTPLLQGQQEVLDLGCFTGGRTAAWYERYGLGRICGLDTSELFLDAARQFAEHKGIKAEFKLGKGESLPFEDGTFESVLSFEVFEHVQNPGLVLNECHRILKTGGRLYLAFPGFFHPTGHHLALVTKAPGVHYLFSAETIIKAYNEILEERGEGAVWYARQKPGLEEWERGNTINGLTHARFRGLIRNRAWRIVERARKPVGSIGRSFAGRPIYRAALAILYPFALLPGLEEVLLHRVTYILEKPGG